MFRFAEGVRFAVLVPIGLAFIHPSSRVHAQSIGDYSRAQRAAIESTIARHGPRPPVELPGLPQLPPVSRDATVAPSLPASPPPVARPADPPPPDIAVTGVIVSPSVTLTEVHVDGTPFLLAVGDRVPGTRWTVSRVVVGEVMLSTEARPKGGRPATRTFQLANSGS